MCISLLSNALPYLASCVSLAMYVLGAGSLGCLWAARLAAALPRARATTCPDTSVTLLLRPGSKKCQSLQRIDPGGSAMARLRIQGFQGGTTETFEVDVQAEEVTNHKSIQKLLLVTKAAAAAEALSQVSSRLKPEAVVVLLCNGALAVHEQISEMPLDHIYLVLGLTTHGAWSRADFDVVHAGVGHTVFGRYRSNIPQALYESTLQQLQTAGLGGTDDAVIERSLWLKLAANAAINPVTALLEKPNSIILETEMELLIAQICEEVAAVAKGIWEGQGFESACPSALEMQKFAMETARQTENNRSSMLQDIIAGRPTEIDYINGWIVKKAEGLQIDVPKNAALTALIKQKEAEREKHILLELFCGPWVEKLWSISGAPHFSVAKPPFTMAPKEIIKKIGEDGFDMEEFKAQVYKEGCKKLHIVDVYTAWCGPCLSIVPTFKNLQMNIDYFEDRCTITQAERTCLPEFEERFPETSKPRFLFYKEGEEVMQIEGLKAPEILKFIEENLPAIETEE
eukprot:s968_g55.t1